MIIFWSQSDSHHDWIYWNKFSMSQGCSRYWEHWLRHTSHWKVTRFLESGHVILLNNLVNVLKNLVKCHFKKDSQPESSFLSVYPLISISPFNTDSAWKPLPLKKPITQAIKQPKSFIFVFITFNLCHKRNQIAWLHLKGMIHYIILHLGQCSY